MAGEMVVIRESRGAVNFLWGFLVLVSAVVLWRGEFGSRTTTTRVVAAVIFVPLGLGAIAAWVWYRRHPSRLEITPAAISLRLPGKSDPATVLPKTGDLYIDSHLVGSARAPSRVSYLKVEGSQGSISLQFFKRADVVDGCTAMGWTFADERA